MLKIQQHEIRYDSAGGREQVLVDLNNAARKKTWKQADIDAVDDRVLWEVNEESVTVWWVTDVVDGVFG